MLFSPLEQFSIFKLIPISFFGLDLSVTNSTLFAGISCFISFIFFNFICSNAKLVPSLWQSIAETLFEFVFYNVLSENIKKGGSAYFPIILTIFVYILSCNLIGMIPYSFTVTSHIVITLGLAIVAFTGINIIGLSIHGFHFFSLFLPGGAPLALAPLLIPIELVSYSFRVVSLALRLFANMMSGHCLLKILAGFAWTMLSAGGFLSVVHLLPLVVIFAIVGLELSIAFLQAYVFSVLLCIYLNDAISLH
uniref:ATP synthase subunit a n=1 Tax=Phaeocystis globosa TaxID=33658 RepID=S5FHH9_9EUKA|nr:ATP synthase F0 subunit 6 [Phaeocystis globosa]